MVRFKSPTSERIVSLWRRMMPACSRWRSPRLPSDSIWLAYPITTLKGVRMSWEMPLIQSERAWSRLFWSLRNQSRSSR